MSGDIQTRKRKDKKRKKEDSTEQLLSQVQSNLKDLNEDVNIHVHKEHGTGGGICAKIVFFLLFSALAVLIGLIITEHRGLTDLDNDISESKFSQLFEGWIDTNTEHNSDEHMENSLNEHISENTSHDVDNEDDDHDEEDQGIDLSKENEDAIEEDDESEEEHDQSEDDEDVEELEDIEEGSELEESEDDLSVEEQSDQDVNDGNEENEESIEMSKTNSKEDAEDSEETFDAPTLKMIDEENEGILDGPQKLEEEETINEEVESKKSRVAVKVGVGFALLVVAYLVLVKKWKSVRTDNSLEQQNEQVAADMSRRNTIVVPPAFQEIKQDIAETVEEDETDDDGEVISNTEEQSTMKTAEKKYQELRNTYTRSLTPESESEPAKIVKDVVDADDVADEYEEEIEEEEEANEEEEEDEEEIEDEDDDDDLLKRLENKYGKLPLTERADSEDEQLSSWKHVNVENEESDSDKQSIDDVEVYEYENITNQDDKKIKDKLDEAQKTIQNE